MALRDAVVRGGRGGWLWWWQRRERRPGVVYEERDVAGRRPLVEDVPGADRFGPNRRERASDLHVGCGRAGRRAVRERALLARRRPGRLSLHRRDDGRDDLVLPRLARPTDNRRRADDVRDQRRHVRCTL